MKSLPLAQTFVTTHPLGVLATINAQGHPETAAVYWAMDADGNLYYLSPSHTRKLDNIKTQPQVSVTFVDESGRKTLQIQGTAESIATTIEGDYFEHVPKNVCDALVNIHSSVRGAELTPAYKTGGDEHYYVKLKPTWMRLADFTADRPERIYTQIIG